MGDRMPELADEFESMSWLLSWADGPWHLHDLEVGGTVLLVDVAAQQIVWETRVTHMVAVPYESVGDLAVEILRRWNLVLETPEMVPGGFCIGWRAESIARVNRGPIERPAQPHMGVVDDELELTGFQQSAHMSETFRQRWAIEQEAEVFCAGRQAMGWFGPVPIQ